DGRSEIDAIDNGVVGNSRLTASVGAVLLIALLVEGVTVFDVNSMFALHAFVGMTLIPVAVLKMCSTGYRFMKYYRGDPVYRQKGPPHVILRILGPLVVVSTICLLGTGATLLAVGPANSDTLVTLHQASFIVWVSVTTIHVVGHITETARLTIDDMSSAGGIGGVGLRRGLVLASLIVGLALGTASLGWNSAWVHRVGRRDGAPLNNPVKTGTGFGWTGTVGRVFGAASTEIEPVEPGRVRNA
ncbi:MAG: hypothetical protein QOJ08_537, partial [Ilumatobacteraceae bacterium]